MQLRRSTCASLLLVGLAGGLACTAILNPRDSVQRCGSATDCDATGDERYVAECRFDEGSTLSSDDADKICVAAFKANVSCDVMNLMGPDGEQHGAITLIESIDRVALQCVSPDTDGQPGCPPRNGLCDGGEQPNGSGICGGPDAMPYQLIFDDGTEDQDVLDQFCKGFFCDDSFVCDRDSFTCAKCDEDEPFGEGGCGFVFQAGGRSCAYLTGDPLDDACEAPDSDPQQFIGGTCM